MKSKSQLKVLCSILVLLIGTSPSSFAGQTSSKPSEDHLDHLPSPLNFETLRFLSVKDLVALSKAKPESISMIWTVLKNRTVSEMIRFMIQAELPSKLDQKEKYPEFVHLLMDPAYFVEVPEGAFLMGSPETGVLGAEKSETARSEDEDQHWVQLSKYKIGKFLMTQFAWYLIMHGQRDSEGMSLANPSFYSSAQYCPEEHLVIDGVQLCPTHPVERVSSKVISRYLIPALAGMGIEVRLPTEAEWERAARGKTGDPSFYAPFFLGVEATAVKEYAWYITNSGGQTHPVGSLKPQSLGIYDLIGNVYQIMSDGYERYPRAPDSKHPIINPQGDHGTSLKVVRGVGINSRIINARTASRSTQPLSQAENDAGFRVVLVHE